MDTVHLAFQQASTRPARGTSSRFGDHDRSAYQSLEECEKMKQEIIEIDNRFGEGYQGKYVFKEITWAKRNRIIQKHTKYSRLSGEVENSDFIGIQAETIMASMHGQPTSNPITLEKLLSEEEGIPIELGEVFSKVVNSLNGVGHEDLRFLLEQLDEESRIRLLWSLGYAKASGGLQQSLPSSQQEQCRSSATF
jgi:hypothetical protein